MRRAVCPSPPLAGHPSSRCVGTQAVGCGADGRHGPLRDRRQGRNHRARPAGDAQRALRRGAGRPDRRIRAGSRRRRGAVRRADLHAREGVLQRGQPGGLRGRRAARPQALGHRPLPAAVPPDRRAGEADRLRRQRACARGRARARARVRSDRRPRRGAVRDAGDQRRRLPVHHHGADLPQRRRARRRPSCCSWASRSPRRRPSGSGSSTASSVPRSSTPPCATGRARSPPSRRC